MKVEIRTINPKQVHMLNMLANLDARSMEHPWKLTKFDAELSRKRTHGIGAIDPLGNLLAYAIYDVQMDNSIEIVRIVVSPNHRRMGFGSKLLNTLRNLSRAMQTTSPRICVEVNERNIEAWKFFREYGQRSGLEFKTYLVKHDPDDYFGFTFHLKEQMACAS